LIQTALGDIEIELDYVKAPVTTANFLHYVHQGFNSNGSFFRTVTPGSQPDNKIKIEVIQACADAEREKELLPPIVLERTPGRGHKRTGTLDLEGCKRRAGK
jgi:peptidyl-prolyl cis-trans isomerase A (cyclophilin A)